MKERLKHFFFDLVTYKIHYFGLIISLIFGVLIYQLSGEAIDNLTKSLKAQESSRTTLRSNLLLNRSFAITTSSNLLEKKELTKSGKDLFDASYSLYFNNNSLSKEETAKNKIQFKKIDALFKPYIDKIYSNQDLSKIEFSKLAKSFEELSISLSSDEINLWGKILNNNQVALKNQERINFLFKAIHFFFTLSLFILMYFSYRRKELDRKIIHSEELHRLLFSSLTEGVLLVNSKGIITSVNKSVLKLLKTTEDRIINRHLLNIFPFCLKEDSTPFLKGRGPFEKALKDQAIQNDLIAGVYKLNFNFLWLAVNTRPIIDFDDKTKHSVIISFSDITDRIEKQKALELQRQKIVRTAKLTELGEMAGGVAHEVNNPLAIIMAEAEDMIELIEDDGEIENEEVIRSASKITKTATRISKIVKGLLKFSRDGDNDPFEESSLIEIFEDTLELCSKKLRERNIKLGLTKISPDLTLECRAIPLSQVFMNMINNASDAIKDLKSEKWIDIKIMDKEDSITIYFTDAGNGIPRHIREKILTPFFTTKEVGKGTGLGLSISVGIVESHGGTLRIDENHQNTRFIITLPKKQNLEISPSNKKAA